MGKDFSKASSSDKLYELACELEQKSTDDKYVLSWLKEKLLRVILKNNKKEDDLLWLKEELLEVIFECFEKEMEQKNTSKRLKTAQTFVSVYSPEYNRIASLRDRLHASGDLRSFENEYYIHLNFIKNTDRDSYGDPKHIGVEITWNYKKHLKKCKRNQKPKEKVLSRFKKPKYQ